MFVQFLAFNKLSYQSILNYLSALQFKFKWFALPLHSVESFRLSLLLKSLKVNIRRPPKVKGIFDIQTLHRIACDQVPKPFWLCI